MMIKCSKCGFENQMGAIFCRGCGEKIDMNSLDPETVAKSKNAAERGKKIAKLIRHLVGIVILLAIIGTVAAAFVPCGDAYAEAPEDALKSGSSKIELLGMESLAVVPRDTAFSVDEINALFNQRFLKKEDSPEANGKADAQAQPAAEESSKAFYDIEHVQFSIRDGKLHATLHMSLAGKVPMTLLLVGEPKFGDEVSPVGFEVESAKWGLVPMNQEFLRKVVTDKYAPVTAFSELRNMFKRTEKIEVKENKLVFSFRKDKAPRTAKAQVKKAEETASAESGEAEKAAKKKNSRKTKKAKKTENAED